MVVLRTADSTLFETAYFVMRDTEGAQGCAQSTMLEEANRILERSFTPRSSAASRRSRRTRRVRSVLYFLLGMLVGIALCVALALLLFL